MHQVLTEGHSGELELFQDDRLNLKIRMRDRNPPLRIEVRNLSQGNADLIFYVSQTSPEPSAKQNDRCFSNVSFKVTLDSDLFSHQTL